MWELGVQLLWSVILCFVYSMSIVLLHHMYYYLK